MRSSHQSTIGDPGHTAIEHYERMSRRHDQYAWPEGGQHGNRNLMSKQMTIKMENLATIRTHNGKGIASFIIGVTSFVFVLAMIGIAGLMTKAGTMTPQLNMLIGLGMISACFVDLIGIALGVLGAVDRSSKKVYPVLGLTLNIGILVLFGALLLFGLSMKAH
jgi:hypothetical protein